MWKSSEGEYAAELSSGKWVTSHHIRHTKHTIHIDRSAEVVQDTKPAGFDERIEYSWYAGSEDALSSDQLDEAQRVVARAFVDASTSNCVRAKLDFLAPSWTSSDGASSIEEAAQMLEAEAESLRALSKAGWKPLQSLFQSVDELRWYMRSSIPDAKRELKLYRELKYIPTYGEHEDLTPPLNFQNLQSHLLKLYREMEVPPPLSMIVELEDVASHFEIESSSSKAKVLEGLVKKVAAGSGGDITYDDETQLIEIEI